MYLPTLAVPSRRVSRAHPRPQRHGVLFGVMPADADDDSSDDADSSNGEQDDDNQGDYSAYDEGDE